MWAHVALLLCFRERPSSRLSNDSATTTTKNLLCLCAVLPKVVPLYSLSFLSTEARKSSVTVRSFS